MTRCSTSSGFGHCPWRVPCAAWLSRVTCVCLSCSGDTFTSGFVYQWFCCSWPCTHPTLPPSLRAVLLVFWHCFGLVLFPVSLLSSSCGLQGLLSIVICRWQLRCCSDRNRLKPAPVSPASVSILSVSLPFICFDRWSNMRLWALCCASGSSTSPGGRG